METQGTKERGREGKKQGCRHKVRKKRKERKKQRKMKKIYKKDRKMVCLKVVISLGKK